jgi:hypothetical protein
MAASRAQAQAPVGPAQAQASAGQTLSQSPAGLAQVMVDQAQVVGGGGGGMSGVASWVLAEANIISEGVS